MTTPNNRFQKILIAILILLIGIFIGHFSPQIISYFQSKKTSTSVPVATPKVENKFILSKNVLGYVAPWDQDNSFKTLKAQKDKINFISPTWYKVQKDGTLENLNGAEDEDLLKFAKENNIKVLPAVVNDCEPYAAEQVLKSDEITASNVKNIIGLLDKNNYDGLYVNYECLSDATLKDKHTAFIKQISDELHNRKKLLGVALHAKSTDEGTWEGPAVQDWKALTESCDQLQLMTYDYSWSTSEAGEIAPNDWVEEAIVYALKNIPPEKIYLGIHFYGYDWITKNAKDLTFSDIQRLIDQYSPQIKTSSSGEKYFTYKQGEDSHTVYYADSESIKPKLDLVNKYNLSGIAIWRLGQEDPKIWQTIAEVFKSS